MSRVSAEKKEVEDYLAHHKLEACINEVINRCMHEKPSDPYKYLSLALSEFSTSTKGITHLHAREIVGPRGVPTLEVEVGTEDGSSRAEAPVHDPRSPANDAQDEDEEKAETKEEDIPPAKVLLELVDGDASRHDGLGKLKAAAHVIETIQARLIELSPVNQSDIDDILKELSPDVGANTTLCVSMAVCRAGAKIKNVPLFKHIAELAEREEMCLPVPMFSCLRGNLLAFDRISMLPTQAGTFREAVEIGSKMHASLGKVLRDHVGEGVSIGTSSDGAYVLPGVSDPEQAMMLVLSAAEGAGVRDRVQFGIDVAADAFFENENYNLGFKNPAADPKSDTKCNEEFLGYLREFREKFPSIATLEDPFAAEDIGMLHAITDELSDQMQIALNRLPSGDSSRIAYAAEHKAGSAVVLQLSQFETISDIIKCCADARERQLGILLASGAHESATENFIVHLATGLASGQVKTGSAEHSAAKCNEGSRIEDLMGAEAFYAGSRFRAPF